MFCLTLMIDDEKPFAWDLNGCAVKPNIIARTFEAGLECLRNLKISTLYLDYDLGLDGKTGYDILEFLLANSQYMPTKLILISLNPIGTKRMQALVNEIEHLKSKD